MTPVNVSGSGGGVPKVVKACS